MRNGQIGVFDLASGQASEEKFEESVSWEKMSSVVKAADLAEEHGQDSIIMGTGVLTASFVPAACAGVIRVKPDLDGRSRIMPMLGSAGVELKLSGFDFVVIKGMAQTPGYLWIRDGIIEFVKAEGMRQSDSWGRTDAIRDQQGDARIQVIAAGPWGDGKSQHSQLVNGYWGGEDKCGAAAEFGRKNLLAVAMRGMGELELAEPEGHFEDSMLLMREQIVRLGANSGLGSYSDLGKRSDFEKITHRHVGCYGCPYPCRTYVRTSIDSEGLRASTGEPGYLHFDLPALRRAFGVGMDATSATAAMIACAKAGAEPAAVLKWSSELDPRVTLETVRRVISNPNNAKYSLVERAEGNFEESFGDQETYDRCLGLGLCPRYWAKAGFDPLEVASFATNLLGKTFPEDRA